MFAFSRFNFPFWFVEIVSMVCIISSPHSKGNNDNKVPLFHSISVCNFIVHERCVTSVVTPCSGIAPCIIKNPVAHCWSEPTHHKRKFCTVCRKRLDETPAVHCMSKLLARERVARCCRSLTPNIDSSFQFASISPTSSAKISLFPIVKKTLRMSPARISARSSIRCVPPLRRQPGRPPPS